ncbi:uncharacterized protein LOC100572197 isoform X1 [Acyrthosiphon pisum]|uniref:Uncharacterized protein n=1 Tax=Acyrthosiphon pisum TaxID=7029 RepID=A0A8R2D8A2_ACYPI|nr:uncharacterized protein LOC100572197 isoform X1 [Acyrthosiphon pisum]
MENLVDDSYVARGLGLITATVGRQSEFYLYSKYDNNFDNISIRLNGRNGEIGQITILSKNPANIVEPKSIPMDYIYDKDRIKVIYTPFAEGVYTLTLVRNSLSICRSPYYISVEKSPTNSRSQIRLGTKKYKPVTKCSKSKQSSLETCDNSIPVIEPSKPSICKNILPESEKTPKRTDVMSIVTKFESNSVNFKKRVHKNTSSISEKSSEADMINEIPKYSNILPKIETYNIHDTYVSDLNVPKIHSKTKSTDKNFWNDVDITYKNSKASDINTIDSESERIKKPMTKFNEHVGITKDIPEVKNVSSTRLQPTNSVLVESLKIENLHNVKKHNQTFKTIELMDENKLIEKLLDPTTRIYESEIKCIDNEPCIQNEVSCFDDEDRKTVVVMDNNEIESNPNDTVTQQIIDSAQYNINTPFASVITKITNSICEKCSIQVLKIISEFPRDINITHKNNSNEMQSSFETLLAQPISININIDNMFEQPINATNEHDSEHLLTNGQTKIKHIGTIDKDIKCSHLNEIESIDNDSDELCGNINNMPKELMIKQNKHNSKIDETIKDEIFDHSIVPFADHTRDKQFAVRKNNELSTNEIMKIKYSTTNEDNVLHSNQFNNNTIHKSDSKMEIHRQHLQKSSEHSIDLIKTNQFHENLNKELNPVSKESNKPLDTSNLVTINFDKNTNCELVTDEFKINNVIFPDENTNIQSSVINNIVLASKEVTLATTEYKSEDNKEQTNNISYKDVTLTLIQNEKQKLIIEKSIEPVLNSFKNKMVEKITQLYLNRDLLNTDNTSTFETHDKHLTNNLHEIQINNNTNSTEIILDQQKTDNNHLHKYVENIIKTKINPNGLYAHTLGEIKLQTLVNTAMNHPNDQQIDIEFKNMIIDNDTQDDKLKKINNDEIVQDLEAVLVEIPSVTIIKNTDEIILPKNEVTVTTQCKIPLINDFDNIEIENTNTDSKQEIQTINVNENDTIVETNAVEIKALQDFQKSHNTEIITPFIELRPTLETRIMNTLELVTVEENSSKEIQTTIDIIDSINIPEETDAVENIDDKNEYETVKLQFTENVIKIPHLVEKETLNEVVQNTSTKSNSTESVSMQAEIESPGLTKVCSANDVTIEKDIIYELPPPAENIFDKSNSQSIPTLNAKVSKNAAKVTIGINTSDLQFSNTAITVLIPSKIQLIENNSFILKLRILSTLDKLDAMEILTIPKYPATCDTEKTKRELQNTPEPTLSPNKLYMKNIRLEKRETIDETIPTDTEIETLEYLNKSVKIKPISNDILEETMESKTEKNTLHKTLNPKYKVTTLESTVNEINCDNTENETTISISSSAGEVVEKPIKKHTEIESTPLIYSQCEPDKKVDEMLICTEAETPTIIDNSTAPLVGKIVVEFVTNKNKIPIEALEIIVHEQIEEDIVTVSEISPTMNSLGAIVDEQVNIKIDGSDTYYVRLDDNVINTGTNTRTSIGQNNAEKIIEKESPVPINTLTGVVMENPKMNIATVTETTSCTNSATETTDVKTDVEKVIEEESPSPISSSGELVQENMNMNIKTENETLLPIESTVESNVEPKIENITEPEITSCTESSTEIINNQFHAEKIVDDVLIDSLGEVEGENMNTKIVTVNETLLSNCSTEESMMEPKVEEDITVATKTASADSSTLTVDVQTDVEKVIEEESTAPKNVLSELVVLNIDTENETLLKIDKITGSVEEKEETDGLIQTILPMKLTTESIKEPNGIEDITEITSCTESSTKIIQYQDHAEKMFDQEALPVPINFLEEEVDRKSKVIIDIETETHLPIVSTIETIEKPKLVESIIATEIPYCTESSTEITDKQIDSDNVIVEPSPTPINILSEIVGVKTKLNINTESEALLPMLNYVEEKEVIEETSEIVLPIESAMEFIQEPKLEEDIIEIKIRSYTDSSTVVNQKDIKNVIEEESSTPIHSLGEVVEKNMNDNIDKENEILLPNDSITGSMEEKKEKDGHIDPLLTMKSTMESIKEPKEDEDITVAEITSCTNSSSVILEIQMGVEKVIEEVPAELINSKIIGEKTKVNIDTEYETILLTESTIESIAEPEINEDITQTKIVSCTAPSNATINVQTDLEKVIEERSKAPINCSDEEVGGKSNVNIHTENEILLPIELTMETITIPKTVENITKTKISSCTDSCILTVDALTDAEKGLDVVTPEPINYSGAVVAEKTNMDIGTGKETKLPILTSTPSVEDRKSIEGTTEIVLPIKSTMVFNKEPKVVEDKTVTEITLCTDFASLNLETKIDVENVTDEVSMAPINSFDEEVGGKSKVNIGTENETVLPIKTSTGLVEDRKAIEGSTELILLIESNIEFKEESIVVEDINVTEITACTDSSSIIVETKTGLEKVIEEVPTVLINSSCKVIGEKTQVNMDTEYETILPIGLTMESVEEPNAVEDITETEIASCTESSTENMIDVQSNKQKYMTEKSPVPIDSSDVGRKSKVNFDTEDETFLPMVSTKDSIDKEFDEVIPEPINSSGNAVVEKIDMNIDTGNETILPVKKSTSSVEDRKAIEATAGIVLPIEFTMEFKKEPKVVEDIPVTEITEYTDSCIFTVDGQTNIEKKLNVVNPVLFNSSGKIIGEKTKVNMDTEYETILPIGLTMESVEEPNAVEDITETEITSCTEFSTENMIDDQTNNKNYMAKKSPTPINSSVEEVGGKSKVNIDSEDEKLLPILSTKESIEEIKIEPTVVTETNILSCTESSTIIINYQNHTEKNVDDVLIDSLGEVEGENMNTKIVTENETLLSNCSTEESMVEPKVEEDITVTTKTASADSSTLTVDVQTDVEKVIEEESPSPISSLGELVQENMYMNIKTENETLLPIESTVESIGEPKIENITEPEITSCTESSTEIINNQFHAEKIVGDVLIDSLGEVEGENMNTKIVTENETLLSNCSTEESMVEPKVEEDITVTTKTASADSSTLTVDVQTDVEKVIEEESPSPISSLGELVQENMYMNIKTENETLLPIESTVESIAEPKIENITEPEITSCTESSTEIINIQFHAEKIVDHVLIDSLGEVEGENMNTKIVTENETLLSNCSTEKSMVEPKVEEDITVTTKTASADSSTLTVDVQTDLEKIIEEESLSQIKSLGKEVQVNTKNETLLQIDTSTSSVEEMKEIDELIKTLLPIKSDMESIKKVEDINETKKISITNSSIITKDIQTGVDIVENKSPTQVNFSVNILGENTKVNNDTENDTILPIESAEELTVQPKVEADITETATTSCTDSSSVPVDVRTSVEKVIKEVSPAPSHSSGEVLGESTKLYIDTENETLLQNDKSITPVKVVLEEKIIENEYSTPTFSPFLDVEKQINAIIDSKTETLFPTGTNTTFVNEPNVVEHVSENEHAAFIDSSITSIKQQIKVDTKTEIETLLLIDNLTESIKEQIVETITENKTPTLIDSLAEMAGEGSKVNIDTDNQTQLTINTSSTIVDDQIVKNCSENEAQTPIHCVANIAEEQTKVNVERNNKTITPIDIFTTSIEEQLNVEYLCENENPLHIDSVPTMIKNQMKINIETENETLLSIENTSFEDQMDEVDKIIQNNLLVDFSVATELKGYEILTDIETEPTTSIDTLNTTVNRRAVKENFKAIESRIQIATSAAFEEEQKSIEHISVKENVLSIGTTTASVEEEIQVEEAIENESATLISYSTIHDIGSLEDQK